jgi:hypothetical protein
VLQGTSPVCHGSPAARAAGRRSVGPDLRPSDVQEPGPRTVALRARNRRAPDLRRRIVRGRLPGHSLAEISAVDRRRPSVRAPHVPQLHIGRPNLPGPTLPHPCVRVAVDEREPIPRPHPQRHQVKARARTLWRKPVPSWEHPRWRTPPTRRKHQAWLRGNWPTPPRFRCRHRPPAACCEPCNPAKTTRPSHVPMMPASRCRSCDPGGCHLARRLLSGR